MHHRVLFLHCSGIIPFNRCFPAIAATPPPCWVLDFEVRPSLVLRLEPEYQTRPYLGKMEGISLVGVFLLLWMALTVSGEAGQKNRFIRDLISTFHLTSPTVLYDGDEAPEICYADQRVLCLLITDNEQKLTLDHGETGIAVDIARWMRLGFA